MHDNLLLCKGVEIGINNGKTRDTCNGKKCPSGNRTFNTNYCKFNIGIVQEVERPLPIFYYKLFFQAFNPHFSKMK